MNSTAPALGDRPLVLSVNLTTACNLACTYCHAIQRRDTLSAEDLRRTADGVGALAEVTQVVPFGGEPVVAWPAFQDLVLRSKQNGVREFLLCTNGLLLTPAHIAFFNEHHVEVTLSWDGVPEANDKVRVFRNGLGTSGQISAVFDLLDQHCLNRPQVRITVAPDTAALFAQSVRHVFERMGKSGVKICFMPVSAASWTAAQLQDLEQGIAGAADSLIEQLRAGRNVALAYNECIRAHEMGGQILFEDEPFLHSCLWGNKMLGVDTDGGVYPCHTVLELHEDLRKPLNMGHVAQGLPNAQRRAALMPPQAGNPYHGCPAWNLVGMGGPFRVAPVYRHTFAAFLAQSVRVVRAQDPSLAAAAEARQDFLLERAARWEEDQHVLRVPLRG